MALCVLPGKPPVDTDQSHYDLEAHQSVNVGLDRPRGSSLFTTVGEETVLSSRYSHMFSTHMPWRVTQCTHAEKLSNAVKGLGMYDSQWNAMSNVNQIKTSTALRY